MHTDASLLDCLSFMAPRLIALQKKVVKLATAHAHSIVLCRRATPGRLRWKCLKRHQNEVFLRLVWTWRCMQLLCFRVSSCLHQPLLQNCSPHVLLDNEVVFAICSTHIGGAPPPSAVPFFDALFDQSLLLSLKDVRFSVLGLGHSEYEENYCKVMRPCATCCDLRLSLWSGA
jgi:hypothetical protein